MMKTNLMPNGNLRLVMQEERDLQALKELVRTHGHDELGLLGDLLKRCAKLRSNQAPIVQPLHPRQSGAWTDTPVLAEVSSPENGAAAHDEAPQEHARLWTYPVKAVYGVADALERRGYVDFVPVH